MESSIENTGEVTGSRLMITLTESNHDKKNEISPSLTIRLYYIKPKFDTQFGKEN